MHFLSDVRTVSDSVCVCVWVMCETDERRREWENAKRSFSNIPAELELSMGLLEEHSRLLLSEGNVSSVYLSVLSFVPPSYRHAQHPGTSIDLKQGR